MVNGKIEENREESHRLHFHYSKKGIEINWMKKVLLVGFSVLLLIGFTGCVSQKEVTEKAPISAEGRENATEITPIKPTPSTLPIKVKGTFTFDARNIYNSPFTGTILLNLKWESSTSLGNDELLRRYGIPLFVVGADGAVYTTGYDDDDQQYLVAINSNGGPKWAKLGERFPLGIGPDGTLYTATDTLYTANQDAYLTALNPAGVKLWEIKLDFQLTNLAIAEDGTIYFVQKGLNVVDGKVQTIGNLFAVDSDGTIKWTREKNESIFGPAIGPDETIYISSENGVIYAYNPGGDLKWSHSALKPSYLSVSPEGTIYALEFDIYGQDFGRLIALSPDGQKKWDSDEVGLLPRSLPIVDPNGLVYIQDAVGLYRVSPEGNKKLIAEGEVRPVFVDGEGTVYITGYNNAPLAALEPSGKLKWALGQEQQEWISDPEDVYQMGIGADGTIYVAYRRAIYAIGKLLEPPQLSHIRGKLLFYWTPPGHDDEYRFVMNPDGTDVKRILDKYLTPFDYYVTGYGNISSDGTKVVKKCEVGGTQQICIGEVRGTEIIKLTNITSLTKNEYPRYFSWSPDGTKIAFGVRGERYKICVVNVDGNNQICPIKGDYTFLSGWITTQSGDVNIDFIDIVHAEVKVVDNEVITRIKVRELPGQLSIHQKPPNYTEGRWAIYFDVDNDPTTGDDEGADYKLGLMYPFFNWPKGLSPPKERVSGDAFLPENVRAYLAKNIDKHTWLVVANNLYKTDIQTNIITPIPSVFYEIDTQNNEITIRSEIPELGQTFKWKAETLRSLAKGNQFSTMESDVYPDQGFIISSKTKIEPIVIEPTQEDIEWMAKVIASEAGSVYDEDKGTWVKCTETERAAVGWTILNRLKVGYNGATTIEGVITASGQYAYGQTPTPEVRELAKKLLEGQVEDPTGGATHFFSPISMPWEGDEEKRYIERLKSDFDNFDIEGGLHEVPGISKKVYVPSWTETYTWAGDLNNVRRAYFMFYRVD